MGVSVTAFTPSGSVGATLRLSRICCNARASPCMAIRTAKACVCCNVGDIDCKKAVSSRCMACCKASLGTVWAQQGESNAVINKKMGKRRFMEMGRYRKS